MKASASLLLLLLVCGCSLFDLNSSSSDDPNIDAVVELEEGESKTIPALNTTITFVEEVQDSRCPLTRPDNDETLNCVWEGEVAVLLTVTQGEASPASFTMVGFVGPDGDGTVAKDTLGLHFTLLKADPFPIYPFEDPANDDTPTITLRVERL